MKNLSLNLKNLLNNERISENELARRTGISQQIINRILSGENKNPKIATLSPLAHYFMVSISQLIGEEPSATKKKNHINQSGWQEIPLIEWDALAQFSSKDFLLRQNKTQLIDFQPTEGMFAIKMQDSSMEPKFSDGTLLIFDLDQHPVNGDFILLRSPSDIVTVRQFFIKANVAYKKCLNPRYKNYEISRIDENSEYLGTLVQSRTDYVTR